VGSMNGQAGPVSARTVTSGGNQVGYSVRQECIVPLEKMDGQVAQSDNNNLLLYPVGASKSEVIRGQPAFAQCGGSQACDCIALALAG